MIRDHRPLFLLTAVSLLAACNKGDVKTPDGGNSGGKTAAVTGRVDSGATGAASMEALTVKEDGSLSKLSDGSLEADGTYSMDVPPNESRVIIAALDADGNTVASAVIATTGEADGSVAAPPLDTETTLEASVFVDIVAGGSAPSEVDVIDLRLRIDATTAADIAASADPSAATSTLALGLASAQTTLLAGYTRGGATVTGDSMFQAETADATAYDASLDAGDDPATAASTLFDAMLAERAGMGVNAKVAWESDAQAGIALRLVVDSSLRGTDVADAVLVSSGALEAHLVHTAGVSIASDAGDATTTLASDAGTTLEADTAASADAGTTGRAWDAYRQGMIGPSDGDTVLTGVLGTDAASATLLARTALTAGDDLDAAAGLAVNNALSSPGTPAAVAAAVAEVWGSFLTDIDTTVATGLPDATDTFATTSLLVLAAGSFRASG